MWIVVPGKCWTSVESLTGIDSSFGVLGPFAEGDYIRRLTLSVIADGTGVGRFMASLGVSEQPNQQSIDTGVPVIQRATVSIGTVPYTRIFCVAGVPIRLVIPVGIRSAVGARFIIYYARAGTLEVEYDFVVSVEVLRFQRAPGEVAP